MRWHLILAAVLGAGLAPLHGRAGQDPTAWMNEGLIGRWHFAGTGRIAADPMASNLNAIAAMPESAVLREQTFQKLAMAPYNFLRNRTADTNDEAGLIRPLLNDLFRAESFAEVLDSTNEVPELVFALRLDENRAQLWETNLATALMTWTGIPVTGFKAEGFDGWELRKHEDPNIVEFVRAGGWIVLGWGEKKLQLEPALLQRIRETTRPVDPDGTNWLDAWADWPALAPHHLAPDGINLPSMRLRVQGRPDFVRSQLTVKFDAPLNLTLNPWQVPTNFIHNPILSFSAVRGVAPRLSEMEWAKAVSLPALPDQVYIWALPNIPMQTQVIAPVANASNLLDQLQPGLLALVNPFLARHAPESALADHAQAFKFQATWANNEITIPGLPFITPRLSAIHDASGDYLLGKLLPAARGVQPLPPELIAQLTTHTNLVYYGWELTGERLKQWHALFQLGQLLLGAKLSDPEAPGNKWLTALSPKLGNAGTLVSLTAPDELTLVRNSALGFTAVELTALEYWLDSPGFPLSAYQEPRRLPAIRRAMPPSP